MTMASSKGLTVRAAIVVGAEEGVVPTGPGTPTRSAGPCTSL
jgi:hypothetical protein